MSRTAALSSVIDHAAHTAYSDPGTFGDLFDAVPTDLPGLSEVARNVIVHYRASGEELPEATRDDINSRWIAKSLELDHERHGTPLAAPREITSRLQGCCRDHTLFSVAVLRHNGVPARSRVGFAGYFVPGWHHDHVIVEAWLDGRWRRFDAELDGPRPGVPDPTEMHWSAPTETGFTTAAGVWSAYRRGEIDVSRFGVDESVPEFSGAPFVFDEVIYEIAHRFGDELLLWDAWGRMGLPQREIDEGDATWLDGVAELLLAADAGDLEAERAVLERYREDDGLHPGRRITQSSPYGDPPVTVDLAAKTVITDQGPARSE